MTTEPARVVIYGAGGLGREALEILMAMQGAGHPIECAGFFVDTGYATRPVHGIPVYDRWDMICRIERLKMVVAVGDGRLRRKIVGEVESLLGPDCFVPLIHPNAVIGRTVTIGAGGIIFPSTSFTSDVSLGQHVVVNPGCTVAHDCQIADFVTLSPAVALAGGVMIGEGCTLGTGASVVPRIRLGAWSVIGAGAAVVRPVPEGLTVVGVPARVLYKPPGIFSE